MKRLLVSTLIVIVATIHISGFAIQYTGTHGHHSPHCPFMPHETGICTMTPIEHLAAWKQITQSTLLSFTLFATLFAYYFFFNKNHLLKKRNETFYTSPPDSNNLLELLLSNGLLNPRIP